MSFVILIPGSKRKAKSKLWKMLGPPKNGTTLCYNSPYDEL